MRREDCKIRMGTSDATNQARWLIAFWGLPMPDLALYQDHSVKTSLGSGAQALRGRRNVTLAWDQLSDIQFHRLYTAWNDAGTNQIWLTIDRGWGESAQLGDWVDVTGWAHRPTGTPRTRGQGKVWEDVRFHIASVGVENDPASNI